MIIHCSGLHIWINYNYLYRLIYQKPTWIQVRNGTTISDGSGSHRRMRPKSSINFGITPAGLFSGKVEWKFSMELIAGFIRATPPPTTKPMIHFPDPYWKQKEHIGWCDWAIDCDWGLKLHKGKPDLSTGKLGEIHTKSIKHQTNSHCFTLHKCFICT